MDLNKYFHGLKRHYYLLTLVAIIAMVYLMNAVIYFPAFIYAYIIIELCLVAFLLFLVNRTRKYEDTFDSTVRLDQEWLRARFDRYSRRLLNWIMICFWEFFGLIMALVELGVNSKLPELLETFNGRLFSLELVTFFVVKNSLILRWFTTKHIDEVAALLQKTVKRVVCVSAVYWLISLFIFYLFEYVFVLNISPFFLGAYFIGAVIFNFTGIRPFVREKSKYQKTLLVICAALIVIAGGYRFLSRDIWLTQPYINSVPNIYDGESRITYDDESGIYTITRTEGDFKILQLTDIHLGGGVLSFDKDSKALKACYHLIEETRPDLVIVTGDLTFPVGYASFSFNNTAPVQQFAAFMRNLGVPWAFTYGNHDTESYAATSSVTLDALYRKLSWKTSRTLLYPYTQPDITGRSNQLIEVRNPDGTLNQGIFLIDSNAYTGKGLNKYDFIHDDQVEWYQEQVLRMNEEEGHIVPSMVFFHIPLQQYRTAYELYEAGSDQVKYYFGSNDEKMINKVCCSEYPSKMFDTARALGSTSGFFCGHDHYNTMSLEYQGIRLTYGMSIDYLAMPGIARDTKQRGGTLITVHGDGAADIEQVPLNQ